MASQWDITKSWSCAHVTYYTCTRFDPSINKHDEKRTLWAGILTRDREALARVTAEHTSAWRASGATGSPLRWDPRRFRSFRCAAGHPSAVSYKRTNATECQTFEYKMQQNLLLNNHALKPCRIERYLTTKWGYWQHKRTLLQGDTAITHTSSVPFGKLKRRWFAYLLHQKVFQHAAASTHPQNSSSSKHLLEREMMCGRPPPSTLAQSFDKFLPKNRCFG